LATALVLIACSASAQPVPPLTSNRPGISDSEVLVPARAIQLEAGVQAQGEPAHSDVSSSDTFGQLTVRVGVRPRIEVFVGWDGLSLDRIQVNGQSRFLAGGNDLRVGTKLAVLKEDRHGVTLAVAPSWSFPVGSEEATSGSNDPSLRLLWARSLTDEWSLSGNVVFTRTSDVGSRYFDNAVQVGITRAFTDTVSAFAEVSGALPAAHPDAWTIDGGVAWIARPDLQWDLSAGHTFADRGDEWFLSAGITVRHLGRRASGSARQGSAITDQGSAQIPGLNTSIVQLYSLIPGP
jgi:outer membrane putative beta-barrel porin/alpha-amylase